MDVYPGSNALTRTLPHPVVAIGNFDGVHVGHMALLNLARERARARGGTSLVLTFEPHPLKILAPTSAPPLICQPERKLELLAAAGIDTCVVEPFTPRVAAQGAEAFVGETLVERLGVREVVVGYNFTYGQRRQGTVETLKRAGEKHSFAVYVIPPVTIGGFVVSSTQIREFVRDGKVESAALLLGRGFDVEGTVVRGAGRGRGIGVPTANLAADAELLPQPGVYAARVSVVEDGVKPAVWPAVVNLGTNPTFVTAGELSLEAHLLGAAPDTDLYGRRLRVVFHSWLRGEQRFPSPQALVEQIRADISTARERLGGRS